MKEFDSSYVLFDDPDARALFDEDVKKLEIQYIEGHELSMNSSLVTPQLKN